MTDFDPELVQEKYFGVEGESHLIGAPGGRDLEAEFWLTGFANPGLLGAALLAIDGQIGDLRGTIAIVGGNFDGNAWNNCTFLGYQRGARFYDGSGINSWCVQGKLRWRQRQP